MEEKEIKVEVPDFIIQDVSLICKNQIQPKYGNSYPKYIRIRDCHNCVHYGLCLHQEEYTKLCESLKDNKTPFTLECPLYKRKEGN